MKTVLFGLALAALGYGVAMWAVKRTIDRARKVPDPEGIRAAQEADAATAIAKAVGGGTWPLWKTGSRSN